ncbi:MAG TPA: hypothetical protein VGS22_29175 [Thermoanaerobaculia bacterium]|jgi:hypothetical protein|nr:hypothetical protein [Thermoanaerobaculia bacterium]
MAGSRLHNALLFVIALCLVLIVVHLYSGHMVAQAQAAEPKAPVDPSAPRGAGLVVLYGCDRPNLTEPCTWKAVRVDERGNLLTSAR